MDRFGLISSKQNEALHYVPDYYAQKVVKWRWIIYPWAVAEDISSIIHAMSPRAADVDEIERRLRADHGIRLPRALLQDILAFDAGRQSLG